VVKSGTRYREGRTGTEAVAVEKSMETMGPINGCLINWEKRKKHKKIEGGENKLTGNKGINKRKICKRSRRK
jgi:hypothetical protein